MVIKGLHRLCREVVAVLRWVEFVVRDRNMRVHLGHAMKVSLEIMVQRVMRMLYGVSMMQLRWRQHRIAT